MSEKVQSVSHHLQFTINHDVNRGQFINAVAGASVAEVGHGLTPSTSAVEPFFVQHPDDETRRIILVDTPGFNYSWKGDVEILRRIVDWLDSS